MEDEIGARPQLRMAGMFHRWIGLMVDLWAVDPFVARDHCEQLHDHIGGGDPSVEGEIWIGFGVKTTHI